METLEPRLVIWGSALLVLVVLLTMTVLLTRWARQNHTLRVQMLAFGALLAALVLSGFAVTALTQLTGSPDMRLVPGQVARWLPAVIAAALAAITLLRGRGAANAG